MIDPAAMRDTVLLYVGLVILAVVVIGAVVYAWSKRRTP